MNEIITSRENPKIKQTVRLISSAKARRDAGLFAAEGIRLCFDVYLSGIPITALFYTEDAYRKNTDKLDKLVLSAAESFVTSPDVFRKMSDTESPQGVLAVCRTPALSGGDITASGRYLALERVSDPSNLGAAARTAEAFGLTGLIVGGGCDPFSPKALRASMGALVRLPVYDLPDFCDTLKQLKKRGMRTVAAVVRGGVPIGGVRFADGDIVMIGNEADGLSEDACEMADIKTTIPMSGRAESLNAAAAAAIAVYVMTAGEAE